MKIDLFQENLIKGLVVASRSVATRATLPVLSHVLFSGQKEGLCLVATNLETGIKYGVASKVGEEGELSVPARIVLEYVSMLRSGKMQLSSSGSQLLIKSGGFEASIDGMSASEFPKLPSFPKEELFSFPKKEFMKAMGMVCFAAATDEGRPVLTGVKTVVSGGSVVLAATDGYRLSVLKLKSKDIKLKEASELSMVIPARSLIEAAKIVNEVGGGESLKFGLTEEKNQAIFGIDAVELSTRLIEGAFPNFEKIIPSAFVTRAEMATAEFLNAVRAASVFARDSANIIKLQLSSSNSQIMVSANAPQVGSNTAVVEAKTEGTGVEVAFNSRFLLEFLANITSETIEFSTEGALNPGVFKIPGEQDYLHIIMPVRVQ